MTIDDRLVEVARRDPHGLLTLTDAARASVSRFAVADACRRGVLVRLAPGLYADAAAPPPVLQRAAVPQRYLDGLRQRLARPAMPSALTDQAAIELRAGPIAPTTPLVVALPRDRQVRLTRPPFAVRRREWDPDGWDLVRGLRCALEAPALADAAGSAAGRDDRDLRVLVDRARSLGAAVPALVDAWRTMPGEGARRLLQMAAAGDFEQESEGERRAFRLLFAQPHDQPDCQVVVLGSFRVDFVFLDAALVVEYFGKDAHEGRLEADMTRIMAIEALGYRVIVVTASMLWEPVALARFILGLRAQRAELIRRGTLASPPLPMQPRRLRDLRTLRGCC